MHYERKKLELDRAELACTTLIGACLDEHILEHLEEVRQLLLDAQARGHKVVDVFDIRLAAPPTAKQRRMQSDWNKEHD